MLGKKRKKSNDTSLYWDETMKKEEKKRDILKGKERKKINTERYKKISGFFF
jgi:hypothetical protein